MRQLKLFASTDLSLPPDSYIYSLVSTAVQVEPTSLKPFASSGHLAAICSDDSLRVVDATTLEVLPNGILTSVNRSVTCLKRFAPQGRECNVLATAGRDGYVRCWDLRSGAKTMEFKSPRGEALSSLECSFARNALVAGTELEGNGPGDAPIFMWDCRKPSSPQMQYVDSHNDTITELQFHPTQPSLLLSGSTDGLVNIYDVSQPSEEDALHQVINHSSAIHHAGFLTETGIYALGTDETVSFYQVQNPDDTVVEPAPVHLGDVRESLSCEYVVNLLWADATPTLAVGSHSSQYVDLVPLQNSGSAGQRLQYRPELEARVRLPGAHGEEIVRDILMDNANEPPVTFSCGEDGHIRAWKLEGAAIAQDAVGAASESKKQKKKASEKGKERRYKPY